MEIEIAKSIFSKLYENVDGMEISLSARRRLNLDDRTLVYGEILFDEFYKILKKINPKKSDIFYDLGCGVGKPTIIGALVFEFKKSIGIDILEDLINQANKIAQTLKQIVPELKTNIEFRHNDIFKENFSDADIVFSHATCFTDEQMDALEKKFMKLKKGAKIILVTKVLTNEAFNLLEKENCKTSWGDATFRIYEKIY